MEKEGKSLILSDNDKFQLYDYKSEEELENIATKHIKEIFGENATYLDIKRKMTSIKGISGIPDGFIIDFKFRKFYILEVELSTHDIVRHISNQLIRFKVAMNNSETKEQLSRDFYDKLVHEKIKPNAGLSDIQKIVDGKFGIVIIIDEITEQLTEIVSVLSQDGIEVITIPFEMYINNKNSHLYKFTTFTKEALENEAKKWTFKWTTVPVKKHLDKTDDNLKKIFSLLSEQLLTLPNVKEKSRKSWVTYQTSPLKNFCTVKFLPDSLEVHLKCNGSFKDEKGITRKIMRTPAWTFDRVFTIKSRDDIKQAVYFIKQSYSCMCNK